MKAYRFFWRAYAVILLMIRHYLIAARLSDGRAYQVIHVLLVLWAIHALLSQLYLWLQARRAAQGREPMLSDASPVSVILSLGQPTRTLPGAPAGRPARPAVLLCLLKHPAKRAYYESKHLIFAGKEWSR